MKQGCTNINYLSRIELPEYGSRNQKYLLDDDDIDYFGEENYTKIAQYNGECEIPFRQTVSGDCFAVEFDFSSFSEWLESNNCKYILRWGNYEEFDFFILFPDKTVEKNFDSIILDPVAFKLTFL